MKHWVERGVNKNKPVTHTVWYKHNTGVKYNLINVDLICLFEMYFRETRTVNGDCVEIKDYFLLNKYIIRKLKGNRELSFEIHNKSK